MSDKGLIHGLGDWVDDRAQQGNRDFLDRLDLKAGESARVRFLTEGDEIVTAAFHSLPTGQPNRFKEVYCPAEKGQDCEACVQQVSKPLRWHAWVYVYYKLCVQPGEGTEMVQIGNSVYYKKPINQVMLLRKGLGKSSYLINKLRSLYQRFGTLVDRDYDWIRQGATRDDTTYDLIPDSVAPFTVATDVPCDLEEAAMEYPFKPGPGTNPAVAPAPISAPQQAEEPMEVAEETTSETPETRTSSLMDRLYGRKGK